MSQQTNEQPNAALYARDMSEDGPDQIYLRGKRRPPELRKLLEEAAQDPRPFDILVVSTIAVLGTPHQATQVIAELDELGVRVETVDGSSP